MNAAQRAKEEEDSTREYFKGLTRDQINDIALNLYKDCARLRRELDDAKGVIR